MQRPGSPGSSDDPRAGDIWYVDFSPQVGREQGGLRPGLIVSNNRFNAARNNLFLVCPLTTTDRGLRHHVRIDSIDGMLPRTSFIMCDQVKAQDRSRFLRYRGQAPVDVRRTVLKIVGEFLDEIPADERS